MLEIVENKERPVLRYGLNDIIEIDDEMLKIESKIFNPDDLRMTRDNFSNLVNMATDEMRAGLL